MLWLVPKAIWQRCIWVSKTDTYDAEGQVLAENPTPVDLHAIENAIVDFRGEIDQVPPMFSAIKKGGKKLYDLAREGKTIEREARRVTIYQLDVLRFEYPKLELNVQCSSGTYIRSLAYDLGRVLGVGAHLSALRRTTVGDAFAVEQGIPLEDLRNMMEQDQWHEHLWSVDRALPHIPRIDLSEEDSARVTNGGFMKIEDTQAQLVRGYHPDGRFIALLEPHEKYPHLWKPAKVFI